MVYGRISGKKSKSKRGGRNRKRGGCKGKPQNDNIVNTHPSTSGKDNRCQPTYKQCIYCPTLFSKGKTSDICDMCDYYLFGYSDDSDDYAGNQEQCLQQPIKRYNICCGDCGSYAVEEEGEPCRNCGHWVDSDGEDQCDKDAIEGDNFTNHYDTHCRYCGTHVNAHPSDKCSFC